MVGDTAQLGNARVDIPITLPGRWKRAARSCRPPRTNSPRIKVKVATESIKSQSIISKRSVRSEEWPHWPENRSCFSHLMPTHGSRVHVFTLQETPPPTYFILESPPRTRLVKVVFGIDREYVHIRSRSLCQPIVIITPRLFKNSLYFKTRI